MGCRNFESQSVSCLPENKSWYGVSLVEGGLKVSVAQQHFHIPGLPATSTPARQMPGAPQWWSFEEHHFQYKLVLYLYACKIQIPFELNDSSLNIRALPKKPLFYKGASLRRILSFANDVVWPCSQFISDITLPSWSGLIRWYQRW